MHASSQHNMNGQLNNFITVSIKNINKLDLKNDANDFFSALLLVEITVSANANIQTELPLCEVK